LLDCPIKSGNDNSGSGNDGYKSGDGNRVIIRLDRIIQGL